MRKPLIGLNAAFRPTVRKWPAVSLVAAGYYDGISAAGGVPVIFPPVEGLGRLLNLVDGVVLTGGPDLDCRRDGWLLHPSMTAIMAPRREGFDRMLMDAIGRRRMPVLGIGVGMQLLNVSQGGTLSLHIPGDSRTLPHRDPEDPSHSHRLEAEPGSLIARALPEVETRRVLSRHHQAIDDVAPGFRATARAPDGVIEAIESERDDWLAVGVQFHPEDERAPAWGQGVFDAFVAGVAESAGAEKLVLK